MPWKDVTAMDAKLRFVKAFYAEVESGLKSMAALCREHGVARKTGYMLIARHTEFGLRGLAPRSRAPHSGRHWYEPDLIASVIELREEFRELSHALTREPPLLRGEDSIRATVRKMSCGEAENVAGRVVCLYAVLSRAQPMRAKAVKPAPHVVPMYVAEAG